jgi:cytoskeleton protein RodZ
MGFLRSYATFLGLDAAEVARRFRAEAAEVNRKPDLSFPAPVPDRGVPAGAVVLMGVLIAVGAYAAWYKFSGDTPGAAPIVPSVPERLAPLADRGVPPSNPSPQVASVLPAPAGPGSNALPAMSGPVAPSPPPAPVPLPVPVIVAPAAPPVDATRMVLRMKADSWVQVREKNGPVLLNRVMRSGETWPVPKGQQLLLTTGNAGGTEIVVDGVTTPSLGATGLVRRDIPLDPDVAKAGATPKAPGAPQ